MKTAKNTQKLRDLMDAGVGRYGSAIRYAFSATGPFNGDDPDDEMVMSSTLQKVGHSYIYHDPEIDEGTINLNEAIRYLRIALMSYSIGQSPHAVE